MRPLAPLALMLLAPASAAWSGFSLRFHGNGVAAPGQDRVAVLLDDVADPNDEPGPPADVGANDFTLELWMRASAAENQASAVACGANENWIYGNILVDRDRWQPAGRDFGLSIAGGRLVFGVTNEALSSRTFCGTHVVLDGQWHHVVVERRRFDGWVWLYVDGQSDGGGDGPDGDISYPGDQTPSGTNCGGQPCFGSDPYLVFGAEKHDAGASFPSFAGWVDEIRLSNVLRYAAVFTPPSAPFAPDVSTLALWHCDEGGGLVLNDSAGAGGGPSDGEVRYGGSPFGPEWSFETPFVQGCGVVPFGLGKATSIGTVVVIDTLGTPTPAGSFQLRVGGAMPNANGLFFFGVGANNLPWNGGVLYAAPPIVRLPAFQLDAAATGVQGIAVDGSMVGTRRVYQYWGRDPQNPDGTGVVTSNGLDVLFCP